MNIYRKFTIAAVSAAALALFTPGAKAQLLEQKIAVTFSGPVMVPGEILPAGSYIFEALRDGSVTRILSADEKHVYATLLTMPTESLEPAEKATVILGHGPEGSPQRIESWFFPGFSVGNEFIYMKEHHEKGPSPLSRGMKDVAAPPEYIAVHAAHVGAHAGIAVAHAGKFIVG